MMGAATWAAMGLVVEQTAPELVAGAVIGGGAALWPDLDHRNGTASKTWGPITKGLGYLTGKACGGHRRGTHTLLAALLAGAGMHAALSASAWLAVPILALLVGLMLVAWETLIPGRRWERLWPANVAASFGIAWVLVVSGVALSSWLPAAVMVGWLAHILGDAVTTGGVRPLLPFSESKLRLTSLRTGGTVAGFRWEVGAQWAFGAVAVGLLMFGIR